MRFKFSIRAVKWAWSPIAQQAEVAAAAEAVPALGLTELALDLFGNPLMASAALDRLADPAHVVSITGASYQARLTTARRMPCCSAAAASVSTAM